MPECFWIGAADGNRTEVCEFLLAGLGFLFVSEVCRLCLVCQSELQLVVIGGVGCVAAADVARL